MLPTTAEPPPPVQVITPVLVIVQSPDIVRAVATLETLPMKISPLGNAGVEFA
jgi:hypothetical protein